MRVTQIAGTIAVVAALAGALVAGSAMAALAAGPTPGPTSAGSDLTVSVPTATPEPSTPPPWNPPPAGTPPQNGGGGAAGNQHTGGRYAGGGGTPTNAGGPADTTARPPAEPRIAATPATQSEKATTDKEHYLAGENVSVRFDGLTPGEQVQIVLYSTPQLIANIGAGADGVLTHTFTLPTDLAPGTHTLQLTGWESARIGTVQIFVTAADAVAVAESSQGVPGWVWWAAGIAGALLLAGGGWWVIRVMRAPATAEAAA